jgi:P27 family predicted phage terminase small subunit
MRAARGRKQPEDIKILKDTRPDRMDAFIKEADIPGLESGPGPIPEGVESDPRAAEAWARLTSALANTDIIKRSDGLALEILAIFYARWRDANEAWTDGGTVITPPLGAPRANPAAGISIASARIVFSLLDKFGGSPASRRALKYGPTPGLGRPEADPLADFAAKYG